MAQHRPAGRLDASSPLVLDTRELGRRPGSLRPVRTEVAAPRRIGLDLVAIPAGSRLELDLRMESVMEGVLVSGTVTGGADGECSRCLEPLHLPVTVHITELYAYAPDAAGGSEDDETRSVVEDLLDLEEAITDAVALELPLQPLCSDDCAGLCSECGVRLAVAEPGHRHETMDPRWAALAAKLGGVATGTPAGGDRETAPPARSTSSSTDHGAPTDLEEK